MKREPSLGISFLKRGECRTSSVRLADSRFVSRGTYQFCHEQIKNSRLKTSHTYITLFPSFVHNWYVVVTYRSIIFTPWEKHVSNTCNSGELIQLRNKLIFIYFPHCMFLLLLGATLMANLTFYYINPPISIDLWSILNQDWQYQKLCNIYNSYYYRAWL